MVDEIERARSALQSLSPDVGRAEWVKIGMAAHAAGLSLQDFMEFSRPGATFNESACKATWRSFKNNPAGGVTAAALFGMARDAGWTDDGTPGKPTAKPPKAVKTPPEPPREPAPGKSAAEVWGCAVPLTMPTHPYLVRKQAAGVPLGNLRVLPLDDSLTIAGQSMGGALLVPAATIDGALQSLQLIPPQGQKMNLPGCPISGALHIVGELVSGGVAYVCEGIGQTWLAWQATGAAAVCAFGWGNVGRVAEILRQKDKSARICIVPDVGKESQARAIAARLGCSVAELPPGLPGNTDINDYMQTAGIDVVQDLLEAAVSTPDKRDFQGDNFDNNEPLDIAFADDLPAAFVAPDELVEGLLTAGDGSIWYGDSNTGKTFAVLDMACAVARGVPWLDGRRTEPGLVVYLAAESPASVRSRLQAYQSFHQCKVPNFAIVQSAIDLFSSDTDTLKIISVVKQIEQQRGIKARLIVGDTLARLSAGANENAGQDMGQVVRRFDRIRTETGAHFCLIHHSGKNAANGARGWSGVRAAVDTEIELTDTPQGKCIEITKQRDLPGKGDRIGFRLEVVKLGQTKWGTTATSCVVLANDAPEKKGKRIGECEGAVLEFLAAHKIGIRKAEVVTHFAGRYEKGPIYRAIKTLVTANAIHEAAGMVCIATVAT